MTQAEIDYYLRRGRVERSKAFHAGFRAFGRALARVGARLSGGLGYLHQPKAFQ